MSNQQKAGSRLKGFEGPYFPGVGRRGKLRGLARVQKRFRYHPERINQMLFDRVAGRLPAGRVRMYVRMTDGYLTTGVILFAHAGKKFAVAFPMLHDTSKEDGTCADRHCSLHPMAATTEEERAEAADTFAEVFVLAYKEMYDNSIRHSKRRSETDP